MYRRRALFKDGAVRRQRQLNDHDFLRYLVEGLRAAIINGVLARYRTSINVCTQDGLSTVRRIRRRLDALIGILNVFDDPPIFRIAILIMLTALIIRSIDRLVASCRASNAVIRNVVHVRVRREVLRSANKRASFIHDQIVMDISNLQDRRPFILVRQLTNLNCRFNVTPLINAFRIYPMEIIFSFRYKMIFPDIKVAGLRVRNDRFLRDFRLDKVARPDGVLSAFTRTFLRILRRDRRALLNDDERVFLRMRLACDFTRHTTCDTCHSLPTKLRLLYATRNTTMRIRILFYRDVIRRTYNEVGRFPLRVGTLLFGKRHVRGVNDDFR